MGLISLCVPSYLTLRLYRKGAVNSGVQAIFELIQVDSVYVVCSIPYFSQAELFSFSIENFVGK